MSRRMTVATLVGAVLVGGIAAPALATDDTERETVCLRLEGESGAREGICVWFPLPDRP